MIEMRIPESILDCVVYVGRICPGLDAKWFGTGFFVSFKHGEAYHSYLEAVSKPNPLSGVYWRR